MLLDIKVDTLQFLVRALTILSHEVFTNLQFLFEFICILRHFSLPDLFEYLKEVIEFEKSGILCGVTEVHLGCLISSKSRNGEEQEADENLGSCGHLGVDIERIDVLFKEFDGLVSVKFVDLAALLLGDDQRGGDDRAGLRSNDHIKHRGHGDPLVGFLSVIKVARIPFGNHIGLLLHIIDHLRSHETVVFG